MRTQIDAGDTRIDRIDDATTTVETRRGVITWSETEEEVEVEVPMPDVNPRKLDVTIAGRTLKVCYEVSTEERIDEGGHEQIVTSKETIRKEVELPMEVDRDSAEAVYKGGVLKVKLRKAPARRERGVRVTVNVD